MARRFASVLVCISVVIALGTVVTTPAPALTGPGTDVPGGPLESDTTWTRAGSPYRIHGTVEVPRKVTLKIEPGVSVIGVDVPDLFLVAGRVKAAGRFRGAPVRIDGGGTANIFNTSASSGIRSFVKVRYAVVENGRAIMIQDGGSAHFELVSSTFRNFTEINESHYPYQLDSHVVGNRFEDSTGWYLSQLHEGTSFRNNHFVGASRSDAWITIGGGSSMVIRNTFTSGVTAVALSEHSDDAFMIAKSNYWGTTDEDVIESMILDGHDGIGFGFIEYDPFLHEPDLGTP